MTNIDCTDRASDFAAQLGAWQTQDAGFLAISNAFVADHHNLKTLVRGLVLSPVFRTVNAAAGAGAASVEGYGTGSLLPPEQLARKIFATTGMHWWRGDKVEWLTSDYNLLYGGIDSVSVTTRLGVPNGKMLATIFKHN